MSAQQKTAVRTIRSRCACITIDGDAMGSARNRRNPRVLRVRPPLVRDEGRPAWTERVLIVRVVAEAQEELVILCHAIAVELHAQSRLGGHRDAPATIPELAAHDDVV